MAQWIRGYEGKYRATREGEIVSEYTGKPIHQKQLPNGYMQVRLCDGKGHHRYFNVHRLIAEAFVLNPENKPEVNHKDGDKTNNHYSNLEWVTKSENMIHSARVLKHKCGNDKIPVTVLDKNKSVIGIFSSQLEASKALGISRTSIMNSLKGNVYVKNMLFKCN